ncbi:ABC transporter permease [Brevibacillus dissolubilis]|uniref:ABC transporter permease n=1 Tax=Brevibacillus dissolubilis TaxID=1844116 RepID=UPI0011179CEB|nr:ABC transporter permease [Brevibacillus dissolubilis]
MRKILNYINPFHLFTSLYQHRYLLGQITKRDIQSKYRGSLLGSVWAFINPLVLLVIYTYVFSVIFQAKWGYSTSSNHYEFALALFCGLISFNIFSETVNKSTGIILSNPNYVKKVVFPLEILPVSALLSSMFQAMINFLLLMIGMLFYFQEVHLTTLLFPILLIPLVLLTTGMALFLSSLGVYVRDIGQIVGVLVTILFYVTPIFYPASVVPEFFQEIMFANPLSTIIEAIRQAILWGNQPDWASWLQTTGITLLIFLFGYAWFKLTRKGFADVI